MNRNNNVKISIVVIVGVRQSHLLFPNSRPTCPETAWVWNFFPRLVTVYSTSSKRLAKDFFFACFFLAIVTGT